MKYIIINRISDTNSRMSRVDPQTLLLDSQNNSEKMSDRYARKTQMKIIGLMGYAGAGKDTVSAILRKNIAAQSLAFADKLRETASKLNPMLPIRTTIDDNPNSQTLLLDAQGKSEMCLPYLSLIAAAGDYDRAKRKFAYIRPMFVNIGHGMREVFGESFWIEQTMKKIDSTTTDNAEYTIITDVRYANECEAIINRGGIIVYINRTGLEPANATEAESITFAMKYVTITIENQSDLQALNNKCETFAKELPRIFHERA